MANIRLNNLYQPALLLFTDVPNIVEVSENINGTNAIITLNFNSSLASLATGNSQYYITVLDETVENVLNPSDAANRRFFMSDTTSTAASVAMALMNCAPLNADFDITYSTNKVYLKARTYGSKLNTANPVSSNIPSARFSYSLSDGSVNSTLVGGKLAMKVNHNGNEVTTLVKNWYGNETAFDVSPVLATFAEYGRGEVCTFSIDAIGSNGVYRSIDAIGEQIITPGYIANDSDPYLPISNRILLNTKRGNETMKFYTYFNEIPLTVLSPNQSANVSWTAYTSNYAQISNGTTASYPVNGFMADITVTIPVTTFTNAYFIDVAYGTTTIRFNVIKPLKAAEGAKRIYWRNEYGGIGFFDFTGAESESHTNSVETYTRNIYDFYDNPYVNDRKRMYKNDTTDRITLTSHLLEKDGKYFGESLISSKRIWYENDGKTWFLTPTSLEVTENDMYNDVYTVRVTFEK